MTDKTLIEVEGKEMTFDEYLLWIGNALLEIKRNCDDKKTVYRS